MRLVDLSAAIENSGPGVIEPLRVEIDYQFQAEAAKQADEPGVFWAAHQADLPYSQIERMCNLGELPPTGFRIACFPLRIKGASGAPVRVVGIVED